MKPRGVFDTSLVERDIPSHPDDPASIYDDVERSTNSFLVTLADNEALILPRGVSSSIFKYFDNEELSVRVEKLTGCTSVIVVSQLGKAQYAASTT